MEIIFPIENNGIEQLEQKMEALKLSYERKKERRKEGDVTYEYEVSGSKKKTDALLSYLVDQRDKVKAFEY
jgi:hypothetical protein